MLSPSRHRVRRAAEVPPPHGTWRLAGRVVGRDLSVLVDRRAALANLALALALAGVALLSLCLGSLPLDPRTALSGLLGQGDAMHVFVVQALRLPRLLAGLATGAAFALAGCLMQTLARNRLATPGIVGIDNGATAFAIASVIGVGTSLAPPPMALVGAATATAITFALASDIGTRGYRFIVAGIGVGAVFGALTQLMMARVAIDAANAAYPWTVGSLNTRDAGAVAWLGAGLLLAFVGAAWLSRAMTVLRFSDAVARGLGYRVKACRYLALMIAVGLTGLAVAVAGPVGLVALIGPEIARQLSSPRGVPLTASVLAGALVMTSADLAGRLLLAPIEVPVGIVTAIIGAPFLLWILLRPSSRFVS
ncbi:MULTISPECIES: iron ABC transporter permease [unclassified Modicisalibacter]|uniref:FecCD family ABC transporter permease n=1 Tax=unclassified Modicisalibacter TaxID=2679913 RepID=UPI001CCDAC2B|nr:MULTISPECIES: iron ABC transporter permease [unclassified Modicisalibacter]MBZ9558783.1 iron ABC transporter permease [Modicisalibacter sp. R2A 31.J]MBZ9575326.1 iron ABC transporter permease [Modicisalibacter sp. MOD 31.J]